MRQRAGIGRYARELLKALSHLDSRDLFRVSYLARGADHQLPDNHDRLRSLPIPTTDRVMNIVWHRLRLPIPIELRTGRLDVFHVPDFSLPPSLAPSIVTIHDLAFEVVPQLCYPTLATYLHVVVPRSIQRAKAVIVPSKSTREAILERYGTSESKIHVIPEGATLPPQASESERERRLARMGVRSPFLLAVGTLEPRKNLERVLEAFKRIRPQFPEHMLVIAGRAGWMYHSIFETHQKLDLGDAVRFVRTASDEHLWSLYAHAELAVYASLYEGFGLPALEALAAGCPLVCSGVSSLPEVVHEAALIFDPWDVEDMAETIRRVLDDPTLRKRLQAAGPPQASGFTWERAAETTSALYHDVARA